MGESYLNTYRYSVTAGICIGIGCTAFLMAPNKIVGALLFTVGLFTICWFGMFLYTGKIGHVIETRNSPNCILILLGNLIGVALVCLLIRIAMPELGSVAQDLVDAKLNQSFISCAIRALMCGALMYIAVDTYNRQKKAILKALGIILCVPTFILCGFEHSIADMGYFIFAGPTQPIRSVPYLLIVIVFNGIGAIIMNWLVWKEEDVQN